MVRAKAMHFFCVSSQHAAFARHLDAPMRQIEGGASPFTFRLLM
jgi:hypothetical protein